MGESFLEEAISKMKHNISLGVEDGWVVYKKCFKQMEQHVEQ